MTPPAFRVEHLNSLSLAGSGWRRDVPIPIGARAADFDARYDFETLWYDAIPDPRGIRLVCPKLLNLRQALETGLRGQGARPARLRLRRYRRHDEVLVTNHEGESLEVVLGDWRATCAVSAIDTTTFAGLNASLQVSRNNRLDWIRDWARWHVAEHGLQAMVLVDNGSTAYAPEDILERLSTTGLAAAVVLSAPLPFGPPRSKLHSAKARYLQAGMFNLVRRRFLSRARAVLVADIDELVWSSAGSVFDRAAASPLGAVLFHGAWRMPRPDAGQPARHADHVHLREGAGPCPTKYCIRPGSLAWRMGLDAHKPGAAVQMPLPSRGDMGYWHCRAITTNWKGHARLRQNGAGPHDASTAAALDRVFAVPRLPGEAARASLRAEVAQKHGQEERADEG